MQELPEQRKLLPTTPAALQLLRCQTLPQLRSSDALQGMQLSLVRKCNQPLASLRTSLQLQQQQASCQAALQLWR